MPDDELEWLKQHLTTMKACQLSEEQELADLRDEYKRLILQHKHLLERFAALDETPPGIYCTRCKDDKAELHEHCPCGSWCGTPGCNDRH
jgi:hypothetical protein